VLQVAASGEYATLVGSRLVAENNSWVNSYLQDGDRLLLSRSTWSYDESSCSSNGHYAFELVALDLNDDDLTLAPVLTIDNGGWWTYLLAVEQGKAVLSVDGGVLVYDVAADPAALVGFYRTYGWYTWQVLVDGQALYLPSGYFGLQAIDLDDGGSSSESRTSPGSPPPLPVPPHAARPPPSGPDARNERAAPWTLAAPASLLAWTACPTRVTSAALHEGQSVSSPPGTARLPT